jgi:hypothetical protein
MQVNIICINPGCWIGKTKYQTNKQEVVDNVRRIMMAVVQLAHALLLAGDVRLCPQLQTLLSIDNKWYTGSDGEAGMLNDRRKVLHEVKKLNTVNLMLNHAESRLAEEEAAVVAVGDPAAVADVNAARVAASKIPLLFGQVSFCRYRFCTNGELKYRGAVG